LTERDPRLGPIQDDFRGVLLPSLVGFDLPVLLRDLGSEVDYSSITETGSMEKFPTNIFWLKSRKSRHQFQINREY
jgi:hypothetical protein